jgi:hypothetical protein
LAVIGIIDSDEVEENKNVETPSLSNEPMAD